MVLRTVTTSVFQMNVAEQLPLVNTQERYDCMHTKYSFALVQHTVTVNLAIECFFTLKVLPLFKV